MGNVTLLPIIDDFDVEETGGTLSTEMQTERDEIKACYLAQHPDARWWLPGDDDAAHLAYWARFDPHSVYFVGGFGDEHYIGYIPLATYQSAEPDPSFLHSIADPLRVQ